MGFFDHKKTPNKPATAKKTEVLSAPNQTAVTEKAATKTAQRSLKGTSAQAHRVLIKPLVTEKAAELGEQNKYLFVVDPRMNKIEIKKAIRAVYGVEPTTINVSNRMGKVVRYGRTYGRTKHWKKAIVTLKQGDTIEIYEGV